MKTQKSAGIFWLAGLFAIVTSTASFAEGTPEQRRACRADAMKFCREFVPNVKQITECMQKNVAKLSRSAVLSLSNLSAI